MNEDLQLEELKHRYSLAYKEKEELVGQLVRENTTALDRKVSARLKVVCRAQAKASIDLNYYKKQRPTAEQLNVWIRWGYFKLNEVGGERSEVYRGIRGNGVCTLQQYIAMTANVFFIEARLFVWEHQLKELQGETQTILEFVQWWKESYASVNDLEYFKRLSHLCKMEGAKDAEKQLKQVPASAVNLEMIQHTLRTIGGRLDRSKTILSEAQEPRSPSQQKIDYLRLLAQHLTVQARLHSLKIRAQQQNSFTPGPR